MVVAVDRVVGKIVVVEMAVDRMAGKVVEMAVGSWGDMAGGVVDDQGGARQ